ncbi:hypothetical protein E2C01_038196 [Portunus trituberculatus]|uniref:Uncharacterized protein n=1 Tax=Portunus trituberculatus TaxID=210409 RepID=A0A5B7FHE0_PORTR|nr:hypothetical protein [Portunus trituberculatus]
MPRPALPQPATTPAPSPTPLPTTLHNSPPRHRHSSTTSRVLIPSLTAIHSTSTFVLLSRPLYVHFLRLHSSLPSITLYFLTLR